jgi:hypothetical protein
MWPSDDEMQVFRALPYRQKLRVGRCLARGEAPTDPQMAAAAVELAASYQRQDRLDAVAYRWAPLILLVCAACLAISAIDRGDELSLIINTLVVLTSVMHFAVSPATRPKNMARALEASRRIAGFTS